MNFGLRIADQHSSRLSQESQLEIRNPQSEIRNSLEPTPNDVVQAN